ncbi:MotA/TolQ/ExbB proton channel family protein [Rickettsiales bacterium]|nr:MotA/TolQ/ExbB proton channel family protein [Rickettsiales bacterium]
MDQFQYIGPLGIPLLILSLAGLAVIIERMFFYLRLPKVDSCKDFINIKKILQENAKQSKSIRDELACFLLLEAKKPYDFGIRILRVIAVTSPMLGLLGTVIGIIAAFKKIALHDGPVYPALIADGLWTAMLTTAVGLAIALPCLFAAFIFARMGEKRIGIYQTKLNQISLKLEGVKI